MGSGNLSSTLVEEDVTLIFAVFIAHILKGNMTRHSLFSQQCLEVRLICQASETQTAGKM